MHRTVVRFVLTMTILCSGWGIQAQSESHRPADKVSALQTTNDFVSADIFIEQPDRSSQDIPENINDYHLFDIDASAFQQMRSESPQGLSLELRSADRDMTLDLVQVDIYKAGFTITDGNGTRLALDSDQMAIHYQGVVQGEEGSLVALSVLPDNEVSGLISIPGENGNLVLGQLESSTTHILYNDSQIRTDFDFICQSVDEQMEADAPKYMDQHRSTVNCAGIHIDLGNDVYVQKGGTSQATNYITGLFNQVVTLYANDDIAVAMAGLTVWTSSEPFSDLNSYGNYRNNNSVYGDLNAYVNYAFGGGIAWVGGLCGNKYSVSGITSSYNSVPSYSWSVEVLTHELGHNLGSPHTHACSWNGNNTAIDGCGPAAGYDEGCDASLPNSGTIMSYCHLVSGVGINFSNGFGSQPAARIANYLDTSPCANSCVTPTCDDGVQNGGESGVDCGGPDCPECPPCPDNEVTLTIVFDQYAGETTFEVLDATGAQVAAGGPFNGQSSGSSLDFIFCLPDGCYDLVMQDSYGDGICCGYGNGSYVMVDSESNILASGGSFTFTESTTFCLQGDAPETCGPAFDNAPVDLTKSYDPVNGVQDRVQVKWFKASPQIKYSSVDSAACDIKFWKKRFLDPETGNVYGDPIQNPDTITLEQVQKNNNNPLFKWPIKYEAEGANNAKRAEPNFRYEWKVRCACKKGDGPYTPWSATKIFNTPDFDPVTGIYGGAIIWDEESNEVKSLDTDLRVDVHPNPTQGLLNVNFKTRKGENSQILVFDMLGNLVLMDQVLGSGTLMQVKLDMGPLTPGNYILQVSNALQISTSRITLDR
ncbi:MAG: T9SS type A sorting domain-containing protein [Flavobacteriales bacterium]|nr:T9SS type A sorting domain-containing protein [Flavobacteriales bacterium]